MPFVALDPLPELGNPSRQIVRYEVTTAGNVDEVLPLPAGATWYFRSMVLIPSTAITVTLKDGTYSFPAMPLDSTGSWVESAHTDRTSLLGGRNTPSVRTNGPAVFVIGISYQ